MRQYVLDASAVIAFLRQEEGSTIVRQLLKQKVSGEDILYLHKATLAEIYYDALRVAGYNEAEESLGIISGLPVIYN